MAPTATQGYATLVEVPVKARHLAARILIWAGAVTALAGFIGTVPLLWKQSHACSGKLCLSRAITWANFRLATLSSPTTNLLAAKLHHPELWSSSTWDRLFNDFFDHYDKSQYYQKDSEEFYQRRGIFRETMRRIYNHNHRIKPFDIDDEDYEIRLAPNQFADMTFDEFKRYALVPIEVDRHHGAPAVALSKVSNATLPKYKNWVEEGCVTDIKNQEHCGSCWAFSATGALEGALCAQGGKLLSLSEQQLVDCAGPEGTHGCNGGFMDNAWQYVIDNGGICLEEDYKYIGEQGACKATNCTSAATLTGIVDIPPKDAHAVRAAVALYGPVSVGIEADKATFQFYHNGIFRLKCGKKLNHAALIVGYGEDSKTQEPYWLVKNSWGTDWGDNGYIKLSQSVHKIRGECGCLIAPSVPLVERRP